MILQLAGAPPPPVVESRREQVEAPSVVVGEGQQQPDLGEGYELAHA
jgi:hypothetical protein